MRKYENHPVYNRHTGLPDGARKLKVGDYCDYCGKFLPNDKSETYNIDMVEFEVHQTSGCEETYYYHLFFSDIPREFDRYKIFTEHPNYIYCFNEDGESCTRSMLLNGNPAENNLETIMELARLKVVKQLLDEGVTPKELGINYD